MSLYCLCIQSNAAINDSLRAEAIYAVSITWRLQFSVTAALLAVTERLFPRVEKVSCTKIGLLCDDIQIDKLISVVFHIR